MLLIVVALCALIANGVTLRATNNLVELYSSQRNQATWFLFQLSKEYDEMMFAASHLGDQHAHLADVHLQYELTWSRFDLIVSSEESDEFMSIPAAKSLFEQLFHQFQALEPMMNAISVDQPDSIDIFYRHASKLYQQVNDYINQNFRISNPYYLEKQQQVNHLKILQLILMTLFIICILLISFIYFQELRHSRNLAITDPLTSLYNRFALFEQSKELLNSNSPFAVYLLDLNGFKQINDHYGHQAGDQVLTDVAERLQSLMDADCTPYRIGGDEFALILQLNTGECTQQFHAAIEALFSDPFIYRQQRLLLSTSLGSAVYPDDSTDIDELLMLADQRMYQMKHIAK